jgi:hypothetical protein
MVIRKKTSKKNILLLASCRLLTIKAKSLSRSVSGTDPRIRIPTKLSRIYNIDSFVKPELNYNCNFFLISVLRIHDILEWIRIRRSMTLTNGSGSCYFRQ